MKPRRIVAAASIEFAMNEDGMIGIKTISDIPSSLANNSRAETLRDLQYGTVYNFVQNFNRLRKQGRTFKLGMVYGMNNILNNMPPDIPPDDFDDTEPDPDPLPDDGEKLDIVKELEKILKNDN